MAATAIYSVTMVLWKETAFRLCRATEKRLLLLLLWQHFLNGSAYPASTVFVTVAVSQTSFVKLKDYYELTIFSGDNCKLFAVRSSTCYILWVNFHRIFSNCIKLEPSVDSRELWNLKFGEICFGFSWKIAPIRWTEKYAAVLAQRVGLSCRYVIISDDDMRHSVSSYSGDIDR